MPPPAEGTPSYERLLRLMREIAPYRPAVLVQLHDRRKTCPKHSACLRRLEAFEARLAPHLGPHWHAMIGGDLRPAGKAAD